MLIKWIKTSKWLHLFTNSIFLLNRIIRSGRGNRVSGWLNGLLLKTSIRMKGNNNVVEFSPGFHSSALRVYIRGNRNRVVFGSFSGANRVNIWILGDDNEVVIGEENYLNQIELGVQDHRNSVITKEGTRIGGFVQLGMRRGYARITQLLAAEGTKITLEKKATVSDGVTIRSGDSHPIYDNSGARINHAKDICIGSGSWICSGVTLLKGAKVGDHSIVGLNSLVTKDFSDKSRVILAGSPAKVVKEEVRWAMTFDEAP
jgi:carbonic anhydrase/acetyltransferase-like protein (isoleucine patch superfamily)